MTQKKIFCNIRFMSNNIKSEKVTGYFLTALSIFIWGVTFVSTKALLQNFSALEILFVRFVIAYFAIWIFAPQKIRTKNFRQELLFVMAGFFGVTFYQLTENIAILYSTASNVSVIVSINPIFTAIILQIFLHEKHITPFFIIGFIIAIAGVTLVSFNGSLQFQFNPKGDLMAIVAGISWGFYSLAISKINRLGFSSVAATRRLFLWAIIFMLPLVFAGAFIPAVKGTASFSVALDRTVNAARFSSFSNWANLLFLSIAASTITFSAWAKACRILGTARIAVAIYLIPVVTTIFAFFVLGENITPMGLAGTACTICGLAISNWGKHKER